jgi:hypothetical protein
MITSTYNNYSPELLAHFPKLQPGQSLVFRVSNTYFDRMLNKQVVPTSTSIKTIDRIYDPGHGKEIDIAYIVGSRPLGPNAAKAEEILLGEISFTRGNLGMFEWFGEKQTEALAMYLFFSNSNGSNVGKPWYLDGTTQYNIMGDEGAKQKLSSEVLIDKAKARLAAMETAELAQLGMAWFPQDYERLSEAQLMLRFRTVAEKDPQRILSMSDNGEIQIMASVNSFIKEGLIKVNDSNNQWLFRDETPLVVIKGDEAPYLAIKRFFATDVGQKVFLVLEEELAASEDKK